MNDWWNDPPEEPEMPVLENLIPFFPVACPWCSDAKETRMAEFHHEETTYGPNDEFVGTEVEEFWHCENCEWTQDCTPEDYDNNPDPTILPGTVTRLGLHAKGLAGSIPSTLGGLTSLTRDLKLSYNELTGTLPTELGKLSQMTQTYRLVGWEFTTTTPDDVQLIAVPSAPVETRSTLAAA